MQKQLLILLWAMLPGMGVAWAQPSLNRIEYFVDADPGFGAGASVPFTAGTTVSNVAFNVPLTGVTAGFHRLFVRTRNATNQWSVVANQLFYKDGTPVSPAALSRIEYFVDADPGFGAATTIPFTAAATVSNVPFVVPLTDVAIGFHNLFVRSLSTDGQWSVVSRQPFFKDEINQPDLVRLEYFIDNDPGYGTATEVAISRGVAVNNLNYMVGLNGVANGAHRLYLRAQNAQGRWSVLSVRDFTVQDNVILITGAPASWCRNTPFNVGFTATGTYGTGNNFILQLSDPTGGFSTVTTLGTIANSTATTGVFTPTIPNSVAVGVGYRLRVVASNPGLTNMPSVDFPVETACQCTTLSSVRAGNWTDPTCWTCNRVPVGTDYVRLQHALTLPANTTSNARSVLFGVGAGLRYDVNARLRTGF